MLRVDRAPDCHASHARVLCSIPADLTWVFNPLTAGAVHIRFLHVLLSHYISNFKPVKEKTLH